MLFEESFKLNEWLDRQGVPPPQVGVSRQGDAAIKRAAYAGGTVINTALEQQPLAEALLVPVEPVPGQPGETFLSQTKITTIGRQPGVYLLLDEATVSRRHAEISFINGQYILHDLGSSNGTFVNDAPLEPSSTHVLKTNDIVRFGKVVKFSFVMRSIGRQGKKISENNPSLAGMPRYEAGENKDKSDQSVLNSDGSLLLPGARMPLPASVVTTFKDSSALVVLVENTTREDTRPPMVFLLKDEKRTTLGREEDMDIKLTDPVVSRRHAEVFPGPAGFYIRDLGSSNGVLVNQARIDNPYLLSHGDRISLGGCMLYFIDLRTLSDTPVRTQMLQETEKTGSSKRPQEAIPATRRQEREPVTSWQAGKQGGSQSASLPQLVVCNQCGGVNTRIARFCASCSAPLGSMT